MHDFPRTHISFAGGSYGHYLKWILYSLLIDEPLVAPWFESTSHNTGYISEYAKNSWLFNSGTINDMCHTPKDVADSKYKVTLGHPTMGFDDPGCVAGVDKISAIVDRVLIPYIDHKTYLLGIHNSLYKQFSSIYDALDYIDRGDLQKGWGFDTSQHLSALPKWIFREHHSLNVFNSWEDQCGWFLPNHLSKSNCKFVFISDLFYNFLPTVEQIREFLGVKWIRDPQNLLGFHKTNVKKQDYKDQDVLASQILNSIVDGNNFEWNASDITIHTEAYIQRALQHQGILLKCNGLNVFPTSTNALIEVFE